MMNNERGMPSPELEMPSPELVFAPRALNQMYDHMEGVNARYDNDELTNLLAHYGSEMADLVNWDRDLLMAVLAFTLTTLMRRDGTFADIEGEV